MRLRGHKPWTSLALVLATSASSRASDLEERLTAEFNQAPRPVRAGHPLLPVNHVGPGARGGNYYISRHVAALARAQRAFSLRDISEKKERAVLELESRDADRRTRVSVVVTIDDSATAADVLPLVLADLFEFRTPIFVHRFVGAAAGERRLHMAGCNHVPESDLVSFLTVEEAKAQGFRPCAICFAIDASPPIANYSVIRAGAIDDANQYETVHRPIHNDSLQSAVQTLGDSLVASLPFEPRGFNYRFCVVDMEFPTAVSFSTGFVYVSSKLVDSFDSRWELAFVLGHEIAHVEVHLPRDPTPNTAVDYERWAERQRESELEADQIAQVCLWNMGVHVPAKTYAVALRKIEYFATEKAPDSKESRWDTYPTTAERVKRLTNPEYSFPTARGCSVDRDGNIALRARLVAAGRAGNQLLLLVTVEGSVALPRPARVGAVELEISPGTWRGFAVENTTEVAAEDRRLVRIVRRSSQNEIDWDVLSRIRNGRLRFNTADDETSTDWSGMSAGESCDAE